MPFHEHGAPGTPIGRWMNAMGPEERPQHEQVADQETALIRQYHVVLLDDDHHSYDYVIEMLSSIFGYDRQRAFQMAVIVDTKKRVVVETTYKERAELRRDQIHAYGPDWRIPGCAGSMSAVVEPAGEYSA
jgi:ATP-dependent Clp protease adaptor protein ClpS